MAFSSPEIAGLRSQITRADRLVYTDGTAMAIGLAESILQIGHLDPKHLAATFRANPGLDTLLVRPQSSPR